MNGKYLWTAKVSDKGQIAILTPRLRQVSRIVDVLNEEKIHLADIDKEVDTVVTEYVSLPTLTKSYKKDEKGNWTFSMQNYKKIFILQNFSIKKRRLTTSVNPPKEKNRKGCCI